MPQTHGTRHQSLQPRREASINVVYTFHFEDLSERRYYPTYTINMGNVIALAVVSKAAMLRTPGQVYMYTPYTHRSNKVRFTRTPYGVGRCKRARAIVTILTRCDGRCGLAPARRKPGYRPTQPWQLPDQPRTLQELHRRDCTSNCAYPSSTYV